MKKLSIVLLLILFIGLIGGCGVQTTPVSIEPEPLQPPEPYVLMLEQLELEDLDMVEKYADLVIKDFPDSDYVYNAYLIKNIITASKFHVNYTKFNMLLAGSEKGMIFFNSKEKEILKEYGEKIFSEVQLNFKELELTTKFILDNFSNSNIIPLEIPMLPENYSPLSNRDFLSLDWFANVGSPIPQESDINKNDNNNVLKTFYELSNNNFLYSNYFYTISIMMNDNIDLKKELLNKVVELTENDKYNEYRIKAQGDLNKF